MSTILAMSWQTTFDKKEFISGTEIDDLEELFNLLLRQTKLENDTEKNIFFTPSLKDLHDPLIMKGMAQSVEKIKLHISNKNRIMVYGDFDADGITSTVILVQALREFGAEVSYRIPDRITQSHGLNIQIIEEIAQSGAKLLLTCDCGINDQEEVEYALEQGLEVIITDHHQVNLEKKPKAHVILNPHQKDCPYPEKSLAGAGVAFKLVQELSKSFIDADRQDDFLKKYTEIAAIGLIADCVPLQGETRSITKIGLEQLGHSHWPGLREILKNTHQVSETDISFNVAPKLNAASRIGNIQYALDLFLAKENHEERIQYLEDTNLRRKQRTHEIFTEALSNIELNNSCLLIQNKNWEIGLLGLVASKLSEKFNRPSLVGSQQNKGDWSFSCRSPKGFSIITALRSIDIEFIKMGGHDGAAGFVIKESELENLQEKLNKYHEKNPTPPQKVESLAILNIENLTKDIIDVIAPFKPFGIGNPEPIFELRNAEILETKILGKEKNHLKIIISKEGEAFEILAFFQSELTQKLKIGDKKDFFFTVGINEFRGEKKLQLKLMGFKE